MNTFKAFMLVVLGSLAAMDYAAGQTWVQTGLSTNNWGAIASSADGSVVIAAQSTHGLVYLSTNSGTTWAATSLSTNYWLGMACSATGTRLVASAGYVSTNYAGGVFVSTNAGVTWVSNSLPQEYWTSVACSGDGNNLVAVSGTGTGTPSQIYTSTNTGSSWVLRTNSDGFFNNWMSVASSADGTKLVAVGNRIFYSTNSGVAWTETSTPLVPASIITPSRAISGTADGTRWALALPGMAIGFTPTLAPVYTSQDFGATWTALASPSNNWLFVSSSADGRRLIAGGYGPGYSGSGGVFTSTNSGLTWLSNNLPTEVFESASSSADGGRWVIGGGTSLNATGFVFTARSIVSPVLNASSTMTNVTVGWIVPSTNFLLQQNFNLRTTNWVTLTNVPVLNLTNLRNEVVLPLSSNAFYRLRTP